MLLESRVEEVLNELWFGSHQDFLLSWVLARTTSNRTRTNVSRGARQVWAWRIGSEEGGHARNRGRSRAGS